MRLLPELRARDPHAAARSAVTILAVCAGVVAGLTSFQQNSATPAADVAGWLGVAALAGAAPARPGLGPPPLPPFRGLPPLPPRRGFARFPPHLPTPRTAA